MPELSILDARLAEIDRRLETIQSGLEPSAGEPEPEPDAAGNPGPASQLAIATAAARASAPVAPLESGAAASEHTAAGAVAAAEGSEQPAAAAPGTAEDPVAAQLDELIDLQRRLVTLLSSRPPSATASAPGQHAPVASVTAGPFASIDALRRFEAALAALPEVSEVVLREYAGEDRAVLDVHLREPTA
jgi:hypothetical protein